MSISPAEGKDNRPFVGVVIPHGDSRYCIPLSSPKLEQVMEEWEKTA